MRIPASAAARAIALSLGVAALGAALPAAAQRAHPHATARPAVSFAWSGVYRISLMRGEETIPARVLMERVDGALYGTFLMDNVASALVRVRGDEHEFRATIVTADGRGEIVLRPAATGVTGTLTIGKATWEIRGERSA